MGILLTGYLSGKELIHERSMEKIAVMCNYQKCMEDREEKENLVFLRHVVCRAGFAGYRHGDR